MIRTATGSTTSSSFVALLRGINVGGKNIIKMKDLEACFAEHGYGGVRTYIQSGNVIFGAAAKSAAALVGEVEAMLAARFGYAASVVIKRRDELEAVVAGAPAGFGAEPEGYRYDVIFCRASVTAEQALALVPRRDGVDAAAAGPGVLYYSRLIAEASRSQLSRLSSMPLYKDVTVRNWNTTTRLWEMMRGG